MAPKVAKQGDPVSLYAGGDRPVWVDYVPMSWRPFVQLTRINFAAPVLLVYFPHLYGVVQTAIVRRKNGGGGGGDVDPIVPLRDVARVGVILLGGSFFYSMAAHAWDDIVDAPLDRLMARTRNRPIARDAVTVRAALLFTSAQALLAASFFLVLPRAALECAGPSVAACFYYPWAKRHTHLPQLVLGFCLAWGVMTGSASLADNDGSEGRSVWQDAARLSLVLACTLWTIIYDTIYAYIDVPEDLRLGLKSTAVLFRHHLKLFLTVMLGGMGISLAYCGAVSGMGLWYSLVAVVGSFVSIGWMIYKVDLSSTTSCYRWFSRGFWLPGLAIMLGLGAELLVTPD